MRLNDAITIEVPQHLTVDFGYAVWKGRQRRLRRLKEWEHKYLISKSQSSAIDENGEAVVKSHHGGQGGTDTNATTTTNNKSTGPQDQTKGDAQGTTTTSAVGTGLGAKKTKAKDGDDDNDSFINDDDLDGEDEKNDNNAMDIDDMNATNNNLQRSQFGGIVDYLEAKYVRGVMVDDISPEEKLRQKRLRAKKRKLKQLKAAAAATKSKNADQAKSKEDSVAGTDKKSETTKADAGNDNDVDDIALEDIKDDELSLSEDDARSTYSADSFLDDSELVQDVANQVQASSNYGGMTKLEAQARMKKQQQQQNGEETDYGATEAYGKVGNGNHKNNNGLLLDYGDDGGFFVNVGDLEMEDGYEDADDLDDEDDGTNVDWTKPMKKKKKVAKKKKPAAKNEVVDQKSAASTSKGKKKKEDQEEGTKGKKKAKKKSMDNSSTTKGDGTSVGQKSTKTPVPAATSKAKPSSSEGTAGKVGPSQPQEPTPPPSSSVETKASAKATDSGGVPGSPDTATKSTATSVTGKKKKAPAAVTSGPSTSPATSKKSSSMGVSGGASVSSGKHHGGSTKGQKKPRLSEEGKKELQTLRARAKKLMNERNKLYKKCVAEIKRMLEDPDESFMPRKSGTKKSTETIKVTLSVPEGKKPGDPLMFSNPRDPSQMLRVTIPTNAKPGGTFMVSLPVPKTQVSDLGDENNFSKAMKEIIHDYAMKYDEWMDIDFKIKEITNNLPNITIHKAKMNKFDELIKEFPSDLEIPIDIPFLRKVVRRTTQNRKKRKESSERNTNLLLPAGKKAKKDMAASTSGSRAPDKVLSSSAAATGKKEPGATSHAPAAASEENESDVEDTNGNPKMLSVTAPSRGTDFESKIFDHSCFARR